MKDYNILLGYKPYEGGAGPDDRQVDTFNSMVMTAVAIEGHRAELKYDPDEECIVVSLVGGRRSVAYDRWGYCNMDGNQIEELDQVDLNAAVAYLLQDMV